MADAGRRDGQAGGPNHDDVPARVNGGDPDQYVDSREWVQVNRSPYDQTGDGEFVAALVSAVADAKGVDALDYHEMPPYDAFDTETLEGTFFREVRGRREGTRWG